MIRKLLWSCALVIAPLACHALTGCEGIAEQQRALQLARQEFDADSALSCKTMPGDEKKMIVVTRQKILVLESTSGLILHEVDWPELSHYEFSFIDTSPYWLTLTRRAFGIRFTGSHHSYSLGVSDELLNLYIVEDDQLKLVLDRFVVRSHDSDKDCDHPPELDSRCTTRMSEFKRTLAIGNATSHMYADLLVDEAKKVDCKHSKNGCTGFENAGFGKSRRVGVLRFDGKHYLIPDALEQNPKWQ